jgi:subtilisin-like proprotein convertase family protein
MVYNTATAGTSPNRVYPGFYSWDQTESKWSRIDNETKTGSVAKTATLVEPNNFIPASIGPLAQSGTNTSAQTFDNTNIVKTINVSGITGNIGNVTCNVKFKHTFPYDVNLYLKSPSGQIVELMSEITDNVDSNGTEYTYNLTFSDAGINISNLVIGNITQTFKPEGGLDAGPVVTPTITSMSGFNTFSPNGTWTLYASDTALFDSMTFTSFTLNIATYLEKSFKLIGETSITYKAGNRIITNSTYSANVANDAGVITALTRTTASAGAIGTMAATLPATVISYAADSPNQGAGDYWCNTFNQGESNGLTDNTTYYFQLWAKSNVQSPASSNEIFSLIPMIIPQ